MEAGRIRVDKWLWSVRVYKSRMMATGAVRAGHVTINRGVAKPSTVVGVGDVVTVRLPGRDRVLEVARVIERRVGAAIAVECLIDHSPPLPPKESAGPSLGRDVATGRPTKRDRRQIDRLRRR